MGMSPEELRTYHRERYRRIRSEAIQILGGKCECGSTDRIKLVTDRGTGFHLLAIPRKEFKSVIKSSYRILCNEHYQKLNASRIGRKTAKGQHGTLSSLRHCQPPCNRCRQAKRFYNYFHVRRDRYDCAPSEFIEDIMASRTVRNRERHDHAVNSLGGKCHLCDVKENLRVVSTRGVLGVLALRNALFAEEVRHCVLKCTTHYEDWLISYRGYQKAKGVHGTPSSARHCNPPCDACRESRKPARKRYYQEVEKPLRAQKAGLDPKPPQPPKPPKPPRVSEPKIAKPKMSSPKPPVDQRAKRLALIAKLVQKRVEKEEKLAHKAEKEKERDGVVIDGEEQVFESINDVESIPIPSDLMSYL